MCGPYWSQWDRSDLESWMGKDLIEEEEEDVESDIIPTKSECTCGSHCMDCLGLSWRDFV